MESKITINVSLDDKKVPKQLSWEASDSTAEKARPAKAMILSLWDGNDRTAMRVDLWTKEMMVDEMADFYYQTLVTMADSYERATHQKELVDDMKKFARDFYEKFRAIQLKENKA